MDLDDDLEEAEATLPERDDANIVFARHTGKFNFFIWSKNIL